MSLSDDYAKVFISGERLAQLLDNAKELAKAMLEPPTDSIVPHLLVLTKKSPDAPEELYVMALAIPFNEGAEKYPAMAVLGASFYPQRVIPVAAALISEAWMADDPKGQPRDDPSRREVIVIFAGTLDRKHALVASLTVERVNGLMIPQGDWQGNSGQERDRVNSNLLDEFFKGFIRQGAAALGFPGFQKGGPTT